MSTLALFHLSSFYFTPTDLLWWGAIEFKVVKVDLNSLIFQRHERVGALEHVLIRVEQDRGLEGAVLGLLVGRGHELDVTGLYQGEKER